MGIWERDQALRDTHSDPDRERAQAVVTGSRGDLEFDVAVDPSISQLTHDLQLRPLAVEKTLPRWRVLARNRIIAPGAPRAVARAYKLLRAEVLKRMRQNCWKTVAVTSCSRGSGATLTAMNLAISLAQDFGQSVLLVELNLINPSFRSKLGVEARKGVTDYLLNGAQLPEVALDIGVDRLFVIPAGSPVGNSSELLGSPRMAQFMKDIRSYDEQMIVLFDLPPVLAFDDAMAFAPLADCAMLVVEQDETPIDDVKHALRRLEPTKLLGLTLNHPAR